jgi:hypothetical protein
MSKPVLPPYSDLPPLTRNKKVSAVSIPNTDRIEPAAAHRAWQKNTDWHAEIDSEKQHGFHGLLSEQ